MQKLRPLVTWPVSYQKIKMQHDFLLKAWNKFTISDTKIGGTYRLPRKIEKPLESHDIFPLQIVLIQRNKCLTEECSYPGCLDESTRVNLFKNFLIEKNYELFINIQSPVSFRLRWLLRSFCVQYLYSESLVFQVQCRRFCGTCRPLHCNEFLGFHVNIETSPICLHHLLD